MIGLLTYRNVRFIAHVHHQPNHNRLSIWEHQMTRMMLTQTLLSILCTLPRVIFVIYSIATIGENTTRNFDQLSIIFTADYLSAFIVGINFASSFYIFLLSSPRFRRTIQIYLKHRFNLNHYQIDPTSIPIAVPTLSEHQC
ncbi:unnamed protein product [Rotaria socialis]|uniref:G-protein coupled receptors family 1 profile domain-containing protein n=1 Tax=Rotaria socialis TaxID=392032 RepID=A0A817U9W9_9BILA|nr:unnamed protein product [Rotaria socialis]CAF3517436.1 unnamed protein product [Rotaria socialis]CAF4473286.1 unnamed protein product [Rotaria socialis]CAF4542042.1 unnamed protein product [Rotaria socialis]